MSGFWLAVFIGWLWLFGGLSVVMLTFKRSELTAFDLFCVMTSWPLVAPFAFVLALAQRMQGRING